MRKYFFVTSMFYLLIFVYVKAQEVNVTSKAYYESNVFNDTAGGFSWSFAFFLFLLFALSVVSFIVFWKYKHYLFAALSGNLHEIKLNIEDSENIGVHDARVVSEVAVHDVTSTNNSAKHFDKEVDDLTDINEQTLSDDSLGQTDITPPEKDQVYSRKKSHKPYVKITIKNGEPKLVIV